MRLRSVQFFLKNCKQTAENCKQTAENKKNWTPLKCILALPKWGQKYLVLEGNFDLGHPVARNQFENKLTCNSFSTFKV